MKITQYDNFLNEERVNPEAERAIDKCNKEYGFKFDIKQRKGGIYYYEDKCSVPIWDGVVYKLYKAQGTTWKVAVEPIINKKLQANRRMDLLWFNI